MSLRVLSVAYPFAPVTADPVGGAEQVLSMLDRAVTEAGGESIVVACEGSTPAGELVAAPRLGEDIDARRRQQAYAAVRSLIAAVVETRRPDVIHLHGIDFASYLPEQGPPVLVTLHLPLDWYPREALSPRRRDVWLIPVSRDQARRAPPGVRLTQPIENGVEIEAFQPRRKRRFAVPERGMVA